MVKNGEILFYFSKNGEMVKNVKFKIFLHKYFICSLEYISMSVYTNVESHLFLYLVIKIYLRGILCRESCWLGPQNTCVF